MFKIQVIQLDSNNIERIIDVKLVENRDDAVKFIKKCSAIPKLYKIPNGSKECFYELSHK